MPTGVGQKTITKLWLNQKVSRANREGNTTSAFSVTHFAISVAKPAIE